MAIFKKETKAKLAKTLKKHLTSRLPWLHKLDKFERVPPTEPHQDELDENALNEALEARLMELIASAPTAEMHVTLSVKAVVPANLDALDQAILTSLKTRFQTAEAQAEIVIAPSSA